MTGSDDEPERDDIDWLVELVPEILDDGGYDELQWLLTHWKKAGVNVIDHLKRIRAEQIASGD